MILFLIKMKFIYCIFVLFSVVLGAFSNEAPVPALLWSRNNLPTAPALTTFSSSAFDSLLHDAIPEQKIVVVFVEETLSNEDFSSMSRGNKPVIEKLRGVVSDGNSLYLPSVVRPVKAIRLLESEGFEKIRFNGEVPTDLKNPSVIMVPLHDDPEEERTEVLRSHFNRIHKVYSQLMKLYGNVLAVYTGRQSSWTTADKPLKRARRADADPPTPEKEPLLMRSDDVVAVATGIYFQKDATSDYTAVTAIAPGTSVTVVNSTTVEGVQFVQLTVTTEPAATLVFNFTKLASLEWNLVSLTYENSILVLREQMWAPRNFSWHCHQNLTFAASPAGPNEDFKGSVTISGLQVQPYLSFNGTNYIFGQAIDCVPYFSGPIWTGLAVVVLLLVILSWGLMMLMDINTNDRFDDPKGKTITISATE